MARVWSCGFELQSATSGIEWETTVGTVSISTTTVRSGAAALRCNPTGGTGYIQHSLLAADDAAAHYYQRVYLRIASMPTARTTILSWSDGSGWIGCDLDNAGKLLINGAAPTSTPTLTTGVWYRLELDYDDGANIATVYLDGVQVLQQTAYDLGGGAKIRVGPHDTTTCDLYFDDYAVNDGTGATQNGLPGDGKIVHLWPNAAGDNNGFATAVGGTAGAANNYTRVDEFPPDDLTSYNNSTATGTTTIDDFNVTDSATTGIGASDSITLVQVGQRAGSSAVTTASIVTRLKGQASGTTTESASIPVNTTAFNTHRTTAPKIHQITALVNPQTSTAWTSSSLDTMQIGYRGNVSQTTQRRITTLWALVEYVPVTLVNGTASVTGAGSTSAAGSIVGAATVTGAGSVSASAAQGASATVSGTGSTTAAATQPAGSATAAAGAVTASSSQIIRAAASAAGSGSVAATSAQRASSTAAGAGSVTASVVQAAAASAAGVGAVTANSGAAVSGTAAVSGLGAVTASVVQRAASAIAGVGAVTAAVTQRCSATQAGAGSVSAAAVQAATASAAGVGSATANAGGTVPGTAAVSGIGAATAVATQRAGSSVAGAGTVSAAGRITGGASVTGAGSATAAVRQSAAASTTGLGQVVAIIQSVITGAAAVAGLGSVGASASGRITPRPVAGITARPSSGITPRPMAGTTPRP